MELQSRREDRRINGEKQGEIGSIVEHIASWGVKMNTRKLSENDQCIFAVLLLAGRVRENQVKIGHFEVIFAG
jgi:hypothetical protein